MMEQAFHSVGHWEGVSIHIEDSVVVVIDDGEDLEWGLLEGLDLEEGMGVVGCRLAVGA